jgi:hypothetical protein
VSDDRAAGRREYGDAALRTSALRFPQEVGPLVTLMEQPTDLWLVPVQGVFRDFAEETFRPPKPFSIQLEPGLEWRSKTEADQRLIKDWYGSWGRYLGELTQQAAEGADSVLSASSQQSGTSEKVASFVVALSLHTRVQLVTQRLRFRFKDRDRPLHEGHPPARTIRLRGWPEDEPIRETTRLAVANTFTLLRRVRQDMPTRASTGHLERIAPLFHPTTSSTRLQSSRAPRLRPSPRPTRQGPLSSELCAMPLQRTQPTPYSISTSSDSGRAWQRCRGYARSRRQSPNAR